MRTATDEAIGVIEDLDVGATFPVAVADVLRGGNGSRAALLAGNGRGLVSAVVRKAAEDMGLCLGPAVMGTLSTSIAGITELVLEALEDGHEAGMLRGSGTDDDEVAAFGIAEAVVRCGQGLSPTAFWRLMESYRLAYLDLIQNTGDDVAASRRDQAVIEDCFDRMKRAGVEFCLRSEAELDRRESRVVAGGAPAVWQTVRRQRPAAASADRGEWGWPRVAARFAPRRRNLASVV